MRLNILELYNIRLAFKCGELFLLSLFWEVIPLIVFFNFREPLPAVFRVVLYQGDNVPTSWCDIQIE